jgi:hypothetical protein
MIYGYEINNNNNNNNIDGKQDYKLYLIATGC